jgi:hypothetical protein
MSPLIILPSRCSEIPKKIKPGTATGAMIRGPVQAGGVGKAPSSFSASLRLSSVLARLGLGANREASILLHAGKTNTV